jgi:diaminopimelate decarboxylase
VDLFTYKSGRLFCEGIDADTLAERFGTPLYVYSRGTLETHYDRLAAAFADLRPMICYSIKSCSNIHVCRVLVDRGAALDAVSGGEIERARRAGCPMAKVVYAGVGKSDAEIRAALGEHPSTGPDTGRMRREPIGLFNIESEPEFENIARLTREAGVRARGALRINPDVDPKSHAYTSTGRKDSKFGVDIARANRVFGRYARDGHLVLDALHLHIGSPVYDTAPYVAALEKTLRLIDELEAKGYSIRTLDLGGGFGADYESDRSPKASEYAAAIVPLLGDRVRRGLGIILEPGRQISANAGILLTRVLYVKDGSEGRKFVICDAGMHTLIRPALYGAFHFTWPTRPGGGLVPPSRAATLDLPGLVRCDVVGPICESADFLAKDRPLPPISRGDLLAVFAAGAYGMSMACTYNTHPLPAEVMVEGDAARVIRRRQTLDELLEPEESTT